MTFMNAYIKTVAEEIGMDQAVETFAEQQNYRNRYQQQDKKTACEGTH